MRFLRKNKSEKTILVISDIHLGAGAMYMGKRNYLEDFHHDEELVDFLKYYSTGDFQNKHIELIVNGDLFDLLAVPFVHYFDDEFWSEDASLEKLKIIMDAHREVIDGFHHFIKSKNKKITYIIGNHDAEFVFPSMQSLLLERFDENVRERFTILLNEEGEYSPSQGIIIKHGHEYEVAHSYGVNSSIGNDHNGKSYFIPPWGSYYVTRIINKFKEGRGHINAVRPIKKFLINGLIYDTLFTIRFTLANVFYFLMVRFIQIFKEGKSFDRVLKNTFKELELWRDYEELTEDYFTENTDVEALIVGHTHEPSIRSYANGPTFINTGTWTKMFNLDFGKNSGTMLTYAQVDVLNNQEKKNYDISLKCWKGKNHFPFVEFS